LHLSHFEINCAHENHQQQCPAGLRCQSSTGRSPLQGWRRVIEKNSFANWAELKVAFNSVDKVNQLAVFDIGGDKYRLVAYIRFEKQILYIKAVLTHREYDKGAWKS
jgi:mRNA interferase HigB